MRPSLAENGGDSDSSTETEAPLPLLEPGEPVSRHAPPSASSATNLRHFHTQSFDSSHNVGLPQRVDCLSTHYINNCAVGSTFLWCMGYARDETLEKAMPTSSNKFTARVGRTLYELQEAKRQAAQRAKDKASGKDRSRNPSSNASKNAKTSTGSDPAPSDGSGSNADSKQQGSDRADEKDASAQAVSAQSSQDVEDDYANSQGSHSENYEASPAVSPKKSVKKRFGPMHFMRRLSRGSSNSNNNGVSPSNSKDSGGGTGRSSFRRSSSKASSEGGNTDTTSGYEKKTRKFF